MSRLLKYEPDPLGSPWSPQARSPVDPARCRVMVNHGDSRITIWGQCSRSVKGTVDVDGEALPACGYHIAYAAREAAKDAEWRQRAEDSRQSYDRVRAIVVRLDTEFGILTAPYYQSGKKNRYTGELVVDAEVLLGLAERAKAVPFLRDEDLRGYEPHTRQALHTLDDTHNECRVLEVKLVADRQARIEQADRDAATIAVLREALDRVLVEATEAFTTLEPWYQVAQVVLFDPAPRAEALLRVVEAARVITDLEERFFFGERDVLNGVARRIGDALAAWDGVTDG